jgi:hypothetical protein
MKTSKTTKTKIASPKTISIAPPAAGLDVPPAKKRTAKVAAVAQAKAPIAPAAAPAPAKRPAASTPVPARRTITSEVIAARAYTIWEQQGRPQGREVENWLLAESQLKEEIRSFTA